MERSFGRLASLTASPRGLPSGLSAIRNGLAAMLVLAAGQASAIYGGAPASANRLGRATVAIGTLSTSEDNIGFSRCTGALIAPTLVLTAAHCVRDGAVASAVVFYAGARPVRPAIPVASVVRYQVAPNDLPPAYATILDLSLDTALLRLAAPVRGRAPLSVGGGSRLPATLRLAGAGLSDRGVGLLKTTRLIPVQTTSTGLLIARTGGSEVCSGDSGGPVVADGPRGPVIWGVASAVLTRSPPCGNVVVVAPIRPRL